MAVISFHVCGSILDSGKSTLAVETKFREGGEALKLVEIEERCLQWPDSKIFVVKQGRRWVCCVRCVCDTEAACCVKQYYGTDGGQAVSLAEWVCEVKSASTPQDVTV